jgi:DNA-binding NarL/FixJ family response regulator
MPEDGESAAATLKIFPRPACAPATRVVVLSDDRLFVEGLVGLLSSEPSLVVESCLDTGAGVEQGAILLLDSRMDCAAAVCEYLAQHRGLRVVFVAAPGDEGWAANALMAGARGLLRRGAGLADMIQAIRSVADGVIWAPRRVISAMLDRFAGSARETPPHAAADSLLSVREREIFRHAATGLANKELAAQLEISEATVKVHLTHIFQKLGLRGRAELAAAYYGAAPRQPLPFVRPPHRGISRKD